MTNNPANTNVSFDAKFYTIPNSAAFPMTASEALPVGSIDVGSLSVDGEVLSQTVSSEEIKEHNGRRTVRRVVTDGTASLAIVALEDKKETRELYHAAKEDANGRMVINPNKTTTVKFVYDSDDSGEGFEKRTRICGLAEVMANGDITFAPGAIVMYPLMLNFIGDYIRISEVGPFDDTLEEQLAD